MQDTQPAPPILPVKPLLRGYLHLVASIVALGGTILLLVLARGDVGKQVALLVYGLSSVVLFGCSALYHIVTWPPQRRAMWRRIDHANIFVLIAGTYTPISLYVLTGWWRVGIFAAVWLLALAGMLAIAPALHVPRRVQTVLYIALGWVALAAIPEIVARVSLWGILLLVLGGLLYTLGALAYAFRWPKLWPRVFGYHEVFHLATIAANVCFFVFMLLFVLPASR